MTTQTLDRAINLLRLLASTPHGQRLVDVQGKTGLTKPTVHRLLETLCVHDLVVKDLATKRYRLGPEVGLLAASAAPAAFDLRELCKDHLVAVAQLSGDTSFLTVRSGYDGVTIDRQTGSYPVKAFTTDIGTRRPLGVGAGGIVLLSALDLSERSNAYASIAHALGADNLTVLMAIKKAVDHTSRVGYAYSNGLVLPQVRALAVPITNGQGKAIAALSIAAIKERISEARFPKLLSLLRSHASAIEQRVKQSGP